MKYALLLIAFSSAGLLLCAQTAKTAVAIFPFVASMPEYKGRASQIQEMVIETLRSKGNIELIDRSKDSLLVKELDLQIREQSMAANGLVQQGKVLGATNMIIGTVSNVSVEEKIISGYNAYTKVNTGNTTQYSASVSFSLQLSDVESGRVVSSKTFNNKDAGGGFLGGLIAASTNGAIAGSREDAISGAIKASKKLILTWINESFPPEIKIV